MGTVREAARRKREDSLEELWRLKTHTQNIFLNLGRRPYVSRSKYRNNWEIVLYVYLCGLQTSRIMSDSFAA